MIFKIFLLGILCGFFAIIAQKLLYSGMEAAGIRGIFLVFLGGAFVEEFLKYKTAQYGAIKTKELDEPYDVILYLVITALGFAALENILVLSTLHPALTGIKAVEIMAWRFITATFLHTLASSLIGHFAVSAYCRLKIKKILLATGIFIASLLHGLYNYSIMEMEGLARIIFPVIIITATAIFLSKKIEKIQKLKGVCNISKRYKESGKIRN